jgi:hypothetical protein
MRELVSPFVRLWTWVTDTGGYPGQIMFCSFVVCLILGVTVWLSNRR